MVEFQIDGKTKVLGVVGHNIGYTMSPEIHNFSARKMGLNAVYVPLDIAPEALANLVDALWELGAAGFNVTSPHKRAVVDLIPDCDTQSVNTVYRSDSGWKAASTDAEGLVAATRHLGVSFRGFRRFVILGNGGVVHAILAYIAKHFEIAPEIHILRRNPTRDEGLRADLPSTFVVNFHDMRPDVFGHLVEVAGGETLVLQATSAPNNGDDLKRFAAQMTSFRGAFIDLVYRNPSALFNVAASRGLLCQDGLPMLIEQARLSQKLWWGKSLAYEDILASLQG